MGANLSKPDLWPDESLDIISKQDAFGELILALAWLGSAYAIAMIFTITKLIDRWKGPRDDNPTGFGSVLGAFILSLAWPLVLIILALSNSY